MLPAVVTCMMSHRPSTGRALVAVLNTYQDAPVRVLTLREVPPLRKYSDTEGLNAGSSTKLGSADPASASDAAPVNPTVA
jgi:hypothetical protein